MIDMSTTYVEMQPNATTWSTTVTASPTSSTTSPIISTTSFTTTSSPNTSITIRSIASTTTLLKATSTTILLKATSTTTSITTLPKATSKITLPTATSTTTLPKETSTITLPTATSTTTLPTVTSTITLPTATSTTTTLPNASSTTTLLKATSITRLETVSAITQLRPTSMQNVSTALPNKHDLVLQFEPTFGPVAGGTSLTVSSTTGQSFNVTGLYVGSCFVKVLADNVRSFVILTPPSLTVNSEPVTLSTSGGHNITLPDRFTYKPNPNMTRMEPTEHITSGGTVVTIFGTSMDAVAEPIIYLTVNITKVNRYNRTTTHTMPPTNGTCDSGVGAGAWMVCKMPSLNITMDLEYDINSNHSKADRLVSDEERRILMNNQKLVYRVTQSSGTAEVFMSFQLDGFMDNQSNIGTQIEFVSPPIMNAVQNVIDIVKNTPSILAIKGSHLQTGCQIMDYHVTIGDTVCTVESLTDNDLYCLPPSEEPKQNSSERECEAAQLVILVTVGYKTYFYGCSRYVNGGPQTSLIVGVTVGVIGTLILVIIAVGICALLKRKVSCSVLVINKPNDLSSDSVRNVNDVIELQQQTSQYGDVTSYKLGRSDNTYSKRIHSSSDVDYDSYSFAGEMGASGPDVTGGSSNVGVLSGQRAKSHGNRYVIQISITSGKYSTLIEGDEMESIGNGTTQVPSPGVEPAYFLESSI